jgi:hypothetical protein
MSESEGSQPVAEGQGKFTFEEAENFVDRVKKDPSILYREREEARKSLHQLIQTTFKTYLKRRKRKANVSLVVDGFGLDQIWA